MPTGKRVLLPLAAGLALADASIVTLALPRLLTELDATVEGVASVIGVYTVVLALALLPAERLRQRAGARRLGAAGLGTFAAACIGCAAAGGLELLLVFRALQALGGAAALVAAFDLLDAGDPDAPGRARWTAAAVVGFAAGPALGGLLTQLFDWRAIFIVQVPVALAGLAACVPFGPLPARTEDPSAAGPLVVPTGQSPGETRLPEAPRRPLAALGLLSAALTAVLFLLVLLLVAGWNVEPLAAAIAVSVLPAAATLGARAKGDPSSRAATGCALVAAGTLALAFLPLASLWWTVIPQALAGLGMGMALPALAGELVPERNPAEAARLLSARHAGIALALLILAPVVAANLASATKKARERGVAIVLDSPLPPVDKLRLAPDLLAGVNDDEPRRALDRALDRNRGRFTGEERAAYDDLAERTDETIVTAVGDSFRLAFVITAALALAGALCTLPPQTRQKRAFWRVAGAALALPLAFILLRASLAPEPVKIADPCKQRELPDADGVPGAVQDAALVTLDEIACHFGSSREELVLALVDDDDAREFKRKYGVDPRSTGDLLQGMLGG